MVIFADYQYIEGRSEKFQKPAYVIFEWSLNYLHSTTYLHYFSDSHLIRILYIVTLSKKIK